MKQNAPKKKGLIVFPKFKTLLPEIEQTIPTKLATKEDLIQVYTKSQENIYFDFSIERVGCYKNKKDKIDYYKTPELQEIASRIGIPTDLGKKQLIAAICEKYYSK